MVSFKKIRLIKGQISDFNDLLYCMFVSYFISFYIVFIVSFLLFILGLFSKVLEMVAWFIDFQSFFFSNTST